MKIRMEAKDNFFNGHFCPLKKTLWKKKLSNIFPKNQRTKFNKIIIKRTSNWGMRTVNEYFFFLNICPKVVIRSMSVERSNWRILLRFLPYFVIIFHSIVDFSFASFVSANIYLHYLFNVICMLTFAKKNACIFIHNSLRPTVVHKIAFKNNL